MHERPKLQTVAEAAGVSTATVSQVMRGAGRISETTRARVLEAASRVAYVPDGRAAALRSGDNREIGLLIHKIANPFNAEVIAGVSDLLDTEGYLVSVLDSRDDAQRQHRSIEALIRNMRGGLLWVPAVHTSEDTYTLLATHRIPLVTFLRRSRNTMIDHVTIENAQATQQATTHLIELGHRRIAYVGGHEMVDSRLERIEGYRKALTGHQLGPELVMPCPDTKAAGLDIINTLRHEHPEITAVVCNGDMVALGILAGLQRMGLKAGVDMSVVGFDDVQDAGMSIPALTTMAVTPYELGRKLARVMLDRIQQPDMAVATVLVQARLMVRETTGSPGPLLTP